MSWHDVNKSNLKSKVVATNLRISPTPRIFFPHDFHNALHFTEMHYATGLCTRNAVFSRQWDVNSTLTYFQLEDPYSFIYIFINKGIVKWII